MKIPTHCPICKGPLLNDIRQDADKKEYWIKRCTSSNHNFSCLLRGDNYLQDAIFVKSTNYNANQTVAFNFVDKVIRVTHAYKFPNGGVTETVLPYFEPNLDNYPEMMERIKILMAFG